MRSSGTSSATLCPSTHQIVFVWAAVAHVLGQTDQTDKVGFIGEIRRPRGEGSGVLLSDLRDLQDLDLEEQPAVGRDAPGRETASTVALVGGDVELAGGAELHAEAALVPALCDTACTQKITQTLPQKLPKAECARKMSGN